MSTVTSYETYVSNDAINKIQDVLECVAPEFVFEIIADYYNKKESKCSQLASMWAHITCWEICSFLPGYDNMQMDFPKEHETIGDCVKRLHKEYPNRDIGELVDFVINKKVVLRMVAELEKK